MTKALVKFQKNRYDKVPTSIGGRTDGQKDGKMERQKLSPSAFLRKGGGGGGGEKDRQRMVNLVY